MLESILYFALGFLCAALLALMASPAIWNRAVTLTRKRIESSVPLTLNEIQADKDQLRAEFAMSTRRLEMSVEELREKASSQLIEIGRKRDDLAKLAEESHEKIRMISELEARASELRSQLRDREDRLAEANLRLEDARAKAENRAQELETLRARFSEVQADADSHRIELVAKQTAVDNLSDRVSDFSTREKELANEVSQLRSEAEKTAKALAREERRNTELENSIGRLKKQIEDRDQALDKRALDLGRMRKSAGDDDRTNSELTAQLLSERARNVELESKLAQSALQMESLLSDASNDNVEKAMASLNRDKDRLAEKLEEISRERDQLKEDLAGLSRERGKDWEEERRENAILRERINDLAAQVTAMTASLEGETSPINRILASAPKADNSVRSALGKGEARNASSLAERIRALQETARQNKAG